MRVARASLLLVGLLLAAPAFANAEYVAVDTWGSPGSAGGQFSMPVDVAAAPGGDIYVVDKENDRIQRFTGSGRFVSAWGALGAGPGQFDNPRGVAVDRDGIVYVADQLNKRVQEFTPNGDFLAAWDGQGQGIGYPLNPVGIAVDPIGNVYVSASSLIHKFNPDGAYQLRFGTGSSTTDGLATDSFGNVFVAAWDQGRVHKFTWDGSFIDSWLGPYGSLETRMRAQDVATDASGNVFATDSYHADVVEFTGAGAYIDSFDSFGTGFGSLNSPEGITVDAAGDVYVADSMNDRIVKFHQRRPRPARPRLFSKVSSRTTSRSAVFRFESSEEDVHFGCRLTGRGVSEARGLWRTCTSPVKLSGLRPGHKAFAVEAVRDGQGSLPAIRSWEIVAHAGRKRLILPATARATRFRVLCRSSRRCRGQVTIDAMRVTLARGRYSVPPHRSRWVTVGLTAAGRRALARNPVVGARATIVDTRTRKRETVPVLLRRR